jgi:hypothetical protein
MSRWDGDISKMGQLAQRVANLARVPSRAARRIATEIAGLIEEEFQAQADPYGNAWQPHAPATVRRWGEHDILTLSGAMRSSVQVAPMQAAGVSITLNHPGEDHQTGWSGPQGSGPARPVLPYGTMPARWTEAINAAVDDTVRDTMRGVA